MVFMPFGVAQKYMKYLGWTFGLTIKTQINELPVTILYDNIVYFVIVF